LAKNGFQKGISKSTNARFMIRFGCSFRIIKRAFVDFMIRKSVEKSYHTEKQIVAKTRKTRKTALFAGFNHSMLPKAWFWGRILLRGRRDFESWP